MSDDPIGDALRADAEQARAEIRAAGLICPSCDVNMADLPDGHMLAVITPTVTGDLFTAKCDDGSLVTLGSYDAYKTAANIALWDDFRKREAEAFKAIIGTGPANYTGLLSVLEQE